MNKYDWVKYEDRVYQIRAIENGRVLLTDAIDISNEIISEQMMSELRHVDIPKFHVGDTVFFNGSTTTVIEDYEDACFYHYAIRFNSHGEPVTPFQITKIDY